MKVDWVGVRPKEDSSLTHLGPVLQATDLLRDGSVGGETGLERRRRLVVDTSESGDDSIRRDGEACLHGGAQKSLDCLLLYRMQLACPHLGRRFDTPRPPVKTQKCNTAGGRTDDG